MRRLEPKSVRDLRRVVLMLMPLYALALLALNGTQGDGWRDYEAFLAALKAVNWVPLYYHFRVPGTNAVLSFLAQSFVYAPLGAAMALIGKGRNLGGLRPVGASALAALILAAVVEGLRLWREGLGADPTNLWIAAGAAALACHLTLWLTVSAELASRHRPKVANASGSGAAPVRNELSRLTLSSYQDLTNRVLGAGSLSREADGEDGFQYTCQGRHMVAFYGEEALAGRRPDAAHAALVARVFGDCRNGAAGVTSESLRLGGHSCVIGSGRCILPSGESMHLCVAVLDLGPTAAVHLGSGFSGHARVIDMAVRSLVEQQAQG
jgi:hypothetical protein